jgi:hypothetical protein
MQSINAEVAYKFGDSFIQRELPKSSSVILMTGHPFSPRTAGISGVTDNSRSQPNLF